MTGQNVIDRDDTLLLDRLEPLRASASAS